EATVDDVGAPPAAAAPGFVRTLPAAAASTGLNADEPDGVPAHYGHVERAPDWQQLLAAEVAAQLASQSGSGDATMLMDRLTRDFEATVISTALRHTRGRRVEA